MNIPTSNQESRCTTYKSNAFPPQIPLSKRPNSFPCLTDFPCHTSQPGCDPGLDERWPVPGSSSGIKSSKHAYMPLRYAIHPATGAGQSEQLHQRHAILGRQISSGQCLVQHRQRHVLRRHRITGKATEKHPFSAASKEVRSHSLPMIQRDGAMLIFNSLSKS